MAAAAMIDDPEEGLAQLEPDPIRRGLLRQRAAELRRIAQRGDGLLAVGQRSHQLGRLGVEFGLDRHADLMAQLVRVHGLRSQRRDLLFELGHALA